MIFAESPGASIGTVGGMDGEEDGRQERTEREGGPKGRRQVAEEGHGGDLAWTQGDRGCELWEAWGSHDGPPAKKDGAFARGASDP